MFQQPQQPPSGAAAFAQQPGMPAGGAGALQLLSPDEVAAIQQRFPHLPTLQVTNAAEAATAAAADSQNAFLQSVQGRTRPGMNMVDLRSFPPHVQQQYMAAAAQLQRELGTTMPPAQNAPNQFVPNAANMQPSILAAIQGGATGQGPGVVNVNLGQDAVNRTFGGSPFQGVDTRTGAPVGGPTPPAPPVAAPRPGDIPGLDPVIAQLAGMSQPAAAPTGAPTEQPMATASPPPVECPNCGHAKDDPDSVVELDDQDKLDFLAMFVGGAPFQKRFSGFAGKFEIGFRSLSVAEQNMAIRQAGIDQMRGKFDSGLEYLRMSNNYQMALAVNYVRIGHMEYPIPAVAPYQFDVVANPTEIASFDDERVRLRYLDLTQKLLTADSMVRVAFHLYERFRRMTSRLEANAMNPDFWTGIEPRT